MGNVRGPVQCTVYSVQCTCSRVYIYWKTWVILSINMVQYVHIYILVYYYMVEPGCDLELGCAGYGQPDAELLLVGPIFIFPWKAIPLGALQV
jgi:hypothetical protein